MAVKACPKKALCSLIIWPVRPTLGDPAVACGPQKWAYEFSGVVLVRVLEVEIVLC
jgi:hypothetical protein